MHPELALLLVVPAGLARELVKQGTVLEGACAFVVLRNSQQQGVPPRMRLVLITKVHHSGDSYQLEVVGGGPELEASIQSFSRGDHCSNTSLGGKAAAPPAVSRPSYDILTTPVSTVSLDYLVNIGLDQLPWDYAAPLCTLLAARLALKLPALTEQQVFLKAAQLNEATMRVVAGRQGRQPSYEEGKAIAEWEVRIKSWLFQNWRRLQEEQAAMVDRLTTNVMSGSFLLSTAGAGRQADSVPTGQASQPPALEVAPARTGSLQQAGHEAGSAALPPATPAPNSAVKVKQEESQADDQPLPGPVPAEASKPCDQDAPPPLPPEPQQEHKADVTEQQEGQEEPSPPLPSPMSISIKTRSLVPSRVAHVTHHAPPPAAAQPAATSGAGSQPQTTPPTTDSATAEQQKLAAEHAAAVSAAAAALLTATATAPTWTTHQQQWPQAWGYGTSYGYWPTGSYSGSASAWYPAPQYPAATEQPAYTAPAAAAPYPAPTATQYPAPTAAQYQAAAPLYQTSSYPLSQQDSQPQSSQQPQQELGSADVVMDVDGDTEAPPGTEPSPPGMDAGTVPPPPAPAADSGAAGTAHKPPEAATITQAPVMYTNGGQGGVTVNQGDTSTQAGQDASPPQQAADTYFKDPRKAPRIQVVPLSEYQPRQPKVASPTEQASATKKEPSKAVHGTPAEKQQAPADASNGNGGAPSLPQQGAPSSLQLGALGQPQQGLPSFQHASRMTTEDLIAWQAASSSFAAQDTTLPSDPRRAPPTASVPLQPPVSNRADDGAPKDPRRQMQGLSQQGPGSTPQTTVAQGQGQAGVPIVPVQQSLGISRPSSSSSTQNGAPPPPPPPPPPSTGSGQKQGGSAQQQQQSPPGDPCRQAQSNGSLQREGPSSPRDNNNKQSQGGGGMTSQQGPGTGSAVGSAADHGTPRKGPGAAQQQGPIRSPASSSKPPQQRATPTKQGPGASTPARDSTPSKGAGREAAGARPSDPRQNGTPSTPRDTRREEGRRGPRKKAGQDTPTRSRGDPGDGGDREREREQQPSPGSKSRGRRSRSRSRSGERDRGTPGGGGTRQRERKWDMQHRPVETGPGHPPRFIQQDGGSNGVGYKRSRSKSTSPPRSTEHPPGYLPPPPPLDGQASSRARGFSSGPPGDIPTDPRRRSPGRGPAGGAQGSGQSGLLGPPADAKDTEAAFARALLLFLSRNFPEKMDVPTVCLKNLFKCAHAPCQFALITTSARGSLTLTLRAQNLLEFMPAGGFPVGYDHNLVVNRPTMISAYFARQLPPGLVEQVQEECVRHVCEVQHAEQWASEELKYPRYSWLGTFVRLPFLPDTCPAAHLSEEVVVVHGLSNEGPGKSLRLTVQQPNDHRLWGVPAACVTLVRPEPKQTAVAVCPVPTDGRPGSAMASSDGDDCWVEEIQVLSFAGRDWQMARVQWGEGSRTMIQWRKNRRTVVPHWVPLHWLVASDNQARQRAGLGMEVRE